MPTPFGNKKRKYLPHLNHCPAPTAYPCDLNPCSVSAGVSLGEMFHVPARKNQGLIEGAAGHQLLT